MPGRPLYSTFTEQTKKPLGDRKFVMELRQTVTCLYWGK